MNGNDIMKAMNRIGERYIAEAGTERRISAKRGGLKKNAAKIACVIAASLALAIPAGAVYTQFNHKAAVQEYFSEKSIKYLENNGLALNYTDENEHIRLTVDTLLSDGHIGSMVLTIEGLDEEGLKCVEKQHFIEVYLKDAQTGEYVMIHEDGSPEIIGGGRVDYDTRTETQFTIWRELQLDQIDTDRDYILAFGMNMRDNAQRNEQHVLIDNAMEGIAFETSFRPNVAVKEFKSDDGTKIWLSQIGYYSNEQSVINKMKNHSTAMCLLRKDSIFKDEVGIKAGTLDWSPERPQPLACGWFDSIVELDKYDGVTIGDTKYMEKE